MPQPKFQLNPARVAHFEAAGWRAYYDRAWLRLLGLIVSLSQEQFQIPFPVSLLAAYYVTRASIAWAPMEHDAGVVQAWYLRFYRLARQYSGLEFDPVQAASLETEYNDVHRRLVRQADKTEFIQVMASLHSAIFGITADQALESARLRVEANNTVDLITGRLSQDIDGDWARLEDYLVRCYSSINRYLTAKYLIKS